MGANSTATPVEWTSGNKREDGSRYLADVTITPVVDGEGLTTHFLGMHRDVTEVHRLERQVQNQKTLIESVVDAAQVAIVLLDEKERVLLDNQEYKKLIGELGKEPAVKILAAMREQLGDAFTKLTQNTVMYLHARCTSTLPIVQHAGFPVRRRGSRT